MVSNIEKWREKLLKENPKLYYEHQSKAGMIGGKTNKKDTSKIGKYIRTKEWRLNRSLALKNGTYKTLFIKGCKPWNTGLIKENDQRLKSISDKRKLWHKSNPDFSKKHFKILHNNFRDVYSQTMKKTNERLMKEDYKKYINQRKITGKNVIKNNPKIIKNLRKYIKLHPNHNSLAALKAVQIQSDRGFVSKPEKFMKQVLPIDFLHNKQLSGSVPDFHSPERKIVIEVDGEYWHSSKRQQDKDSLHNKNWMDSGYKVFRLPCKDIKEYIEPLFKDG